MDGTNISLSHGNTSFKRFLITDILHRTAFYHNTYFRNFQKVVNGLDRLLDKVRSIEVYLIVGTAVDTLP